MTRSLFTGLLTTTLLLAIFAVACDDDDTPTGSTEPTQKALMTAYAYLNDDSLTFYGDIYGIDGTMPAVDSVVIGADRINVRETWDRIPYLAVIHGDPTPGITSGDTLPVKIYTPDGVCQARTVVLDMDRDTVSIAAASPVHAGDYLPLGEDVVIEWHPIAAADWYQISWFYQFDSALHLTQRRHEFYTTDTSLLIPGSIAAYDGHFNISVRSVAGPLPDDPAGNIEGEVVKGSIVGVAGTLFTIYMGMGIPAPAVTSEPSIY